MIDLDDIPEALRDVNGQISGGDSAAIFEVRVQVYFLSTACERNTHLHAMKGIQ